MRSYELMAELTNKEYFNEAYKVAQEWAAEWAESRMVEVCAVPGYYLKLSIMDGFGQITIWYYCGIGNGAAWMETNGRYTCGCKPMYAFRIEYQKRVGKFFRLF